MATRKRAGSEMNFDASLQKLEAIVKRLEDEEIPLEESLKLFGEGQTLARACEEQLRAAENQIRLLLEKSTGEIEERKFNTGEPGGDIEDEEEEAEDSEKS
jgi:exodeoxyribonuclease VII small subunit